MSRRALITLVVLAVVATAGGVAGGLLLARPQEPAAASAAPTTIAAAAPPPTDTLEPTTSGSTTTTTASSTSTTTRVSVRARLVQRLEDGLVVRYDASQPVSAVLAWGFGGASGNQVAFPGPASQGSVKLTLTNTTKAVSMRVIGRAADGRQGVSGTLTARRLVRQVVLEVRSLRLDIPNGTAGIATGFLGTTVIPLGPGVSGPTATAQPYEFPPVALAAGVTGSPLALRFFHQVQPNPQRTRVVNLAITYPRSGTSTFLTRDVTAIGVTVHLRLRLTVTSF